MATYTNKLNLIKPEINDLVSPTVFADNFDKIDAAYGGLSSDLATTDSNLEKLNSNLENYIKNANIKTKTLSTTDETTTEQYGNLNSGLHMNSAIILGVSVSFSGFVVPYAFNGYLFIHCSNFDGSPIISTNVGTVIIKYLEL